MQIKMILKYHPHCQIKISMKYTYLMLARMKTGIILLGRNLTISDKITWDSPIYTEIPFLEIHRTKIQKHTFTKIFIPLLF